MYNSLPEPQREMRNNNWRWKRGRNQSWYFYI